MWRAKRSDKRKNVPILHVNKLREYVYMYKEWPTLYMYTYIRGGGGGGGGIARVNTCTLTCVT